LPASALIPFALFRLPQPLYSGTCYTSDHLGHPNFGKFVAYTFDDAQLGAWHGVRRAQYRIVVHIRTAHTIQWPASRNRSLSRIFCRRPTQTGCEPL